MGILVGKYINRASLVTSFLNMVYNLRSMEVSVVLLREINCTSTDPVVHEFHCQSVGVADGRVVRLEADGQVLGLPRTDSTPYWRHTEHTQPTVVLGSWCQTRGMLGKYTYMNNILYMYCAFLSFTLHFYITLKKIP